MGTGGKIPELEQAFCIWDGGPTLTQDSNDVCLESTAESSSAKLAREAPNDSEKRLQSAK